MQLRTLSLALVASRFAGAAALLIGCAGAAEMPPAVPDPGVAEPPPPPPSRLAASSEMSAAQVTFSDEALAGGMIESTASSHKSSPPPAPRQARGPGPAPAKPPTPPTSPASVASVPPPEVAPAPHREALLIYTATLVLAVYQVETSLTHIEEIARTVGGYLASRTDASIVIRVPRARFHESLDEIGKLGDVLHRDIQAQDVSDQVVDLEARLKSARAVRERLAQLLQGATATKDALEIEKELARVMGEIEVMEGKLQLFADKVAYSTVTVRFQPLQSSDVHVMARLPFPWLQELGLAPLLRVK